MEFADLPFCFSRNCLRRHICSLFEPICIFSLFLHGNSTRCFAVDRVKHLVRSVKTLELLSRGGGQERLRQLEDSLFFWVNSAIRHNISVITQLSRQFNGRGIAIPTGNDQARTAFLAARALRMLGCRLPIEVVYIGDKDLSPSCRAPFQQIRDLYFTDCSGFLNIAVLQNVRGFDLKPFLALCSRFQKTIVMDSDVLFFQDPEKLFEFDGYVKTGTLFFADRFLPEGPCECHWLLTFLNTTDLSSEISNTNYFKCKTSHLMEAGVVVLDKSNPAVLLGLLTVCRLSIYPLRNHVHSYGDKELFWIGFELADVMYSIEFDVGIIGQVNGQRLCGKILHFDLKGKPLWVQTSKEPQEIWDEFSHYAQEPSDHSIPWTGCIKQHKVPFRKLTLEHKKIHSAVLKDVSNGRTLFDQLSQYHN